MEMLKTMPWWELGLYGLLLLAGIILVFWLYYRGKP
jgi:hypothetical protein